MKAFAFVISKQPACAAPSGARPGAIAARRWHHAGQLGGVERRGTAP
jgi:hypothetical protein